MKNAATLILACTAAAKAERKLSAQVEAFPDGVKRYAQVRIGTKRNVVTGDTEGFFVYTHAGIDQHFDWLAGVCSANTSQRRAHAHAEFDADAAAVRSRQGAEGFTAALGALDDALRTTDKATSALLAYKPKTVAEFAKVAGYLGREHRAGRMVAKQLENWLIRNGRAA